VVLPEPHDRRNRRQLLRPAEAGQRRKSDGRRRCEVLERLRVLRRIKRRVRVVWHQGGQQSRQATSAYVLHPPRHSEFSSRTVFQGDMLRFCQVDKKVQLRNAGPDLIKLVAELKSALL
jgi:hypothetical protein